MKALVDTPMPRPSREPSSRSFPLNTLFYFATYRKIYSFVSEYFELPPPSEVYVLLEKPGGLSRRAVGACDCAKFMWFKTLPPEPDIFAHEVLHLAGLDELESTLFSDVVVLLAGRGVEPRSFPTALLRSDPAALAGAVGFNCLAEAVLYVGQIPHMLLVEAEELDEVPADACELEEAVFKHNTRLHGRRIARALAVYDLLHAAKHSQAALSLLVELLDAL